MERERQRISWKDPQYRWITILKLTTIAAAIAVLILVIRPIAIDQSTYSEATAYLDDKMANATMLSLGTTSASLIVTLLPDDTGTPIANELAKYSGYLLLVTSTIFLERYLITTIGFVASTIVLPAAFLFMAFALFARPANKMKY